MRRGLVLLVPALVAVVLALPALAGAAAPAAAQAAATTGSDVPTGPPRLAAYDAAVVLAEGDTVYVDPTQSRVFTRIQADQIRGKITRVGGSPIYVAVLPGNALTGDGEQQLKELTLRLGYQVKATIAVVTGGRLRAASTAIPYSLAAQLADQAIAKNDGEPLEVTISDFIDRIAKEEGRSDSGGTGGVITGVISTIVVFGGGGILLLRRRRRWRELVRLQPLVQEDLEGIAKELLTVIEPEAATVREPLERAARAFKKARGVEHLPAVAAELVRARRALVVARAELAGEVPPPDRAPCFFDCRHGASTDDVEWTPASGAAARVVAACAVDAQRVRSGLAPIAREVASGSDPGSTLVPWYEAGPVFRYFLAPGRPAEVAGLPAGAPLRLRRWVP